MRLTHVDFVASSASSARTGMVLFVIGSLLVGAAVMDDASRSDELVQLQGRVKKAKAAYKRVEATRAPDHGIGLAGVSQSGDINRRLATPWGNLLDALEHAQNDAIALLAIEPSVEQGRLRLSGEAKDMDALVDYIKSLDGKAGLSELRLLTQQIKQSDPQHPVEFVVESHWLHKTPRGIAMEASS